MRRLLFPLTVSLPPMQAGAGHMLNVVRSGCGLSARFIGPVGIFHCEGARSEAGETQLRDAFSRGGEGSVRALRDEPHDETTTCWLHGESFCLSLEET